jgi:nitrogen-specific signal transduction histidine kinase
MDGSSSKASVMPDAGSEPGAAELIFAMCHEIGNAMAAVRLQAHLLDDELDAKSLALASLVIDDMAARSSALLALVRPVLAESGGASLPTKGDAIFAALARALEEHGGRGASLRFESESDLPEVSADPEVIHFLILAQVFCALEAVQPRGSVRVSAAREGSELVFAVEDDGLLDDEEIDWRSQSLRGRSLACAVADHVLRKQNGRFGLARRGDLNRAELRLPVEE